MGGYAARQRRRQRRANTNQLAYPPGYLRYQSLKSIHGLDAEELFAEVMAEEIRKNVDVDEDVIERVRKMLDEQEKKS